MTERAEGFWWVRLGAGPGLRNVVLGDAPPSPWRPLWSYGDSLMTHDPRDGGEFVAMKERVHEWGPYLGKWPDGSPEADEARRRHGRETPSIMALTIEVGEGGELL